MEWNFLEKMGFGVKWITLIMRCISSVSCSILVNEEPKDDILPLRGIRQGDPLSLYLCLLCLEDLDRLLHTAAREDQIRGFFCVE